MQLFALLVELFEQEVVVLWDFSVEILGLFGTFRSRFWDFLGLFGPDSGAFCDLSVEILGLCGTFRY